MKAMAILAWLVLAVAAAAEAATRHIILMIGDGWGRSQLDATAYWHGARQLYETDPAWVRYGLTNFSHVSATDLPPAGDGEFAGIHGYDPALAWSQWSYMLSFATDSGAAATAMACGEKTYNGAIGYGLGAGPGERVPLPSIFEFAEQSGLATGVVTSVFLNDATPACFLTHAVHRDSLAAIARGMIASEAEVIMAAGHPHFDNDGQPAPADPGDPVPWQYVGGPALWQQLVDGTAGGERPWHLLSTLADFAALAEGTLDLERVIGIPEVHESLQFDRSGATMPIPANFNSPLPPYTDPLTATVPSLAVMAAGALNVLGRDPDGFCLMIEAGAIDSGGHARLLGRSLEDADAFNDAIAVVVAWVEAHSNWDETVVMITGDHETGYLWGEGVDAAQPATWFTTLQDRGPGVMPGFRYYSAPNGEATWAGHTNQAIPFFARGAGVALLASYADVVDPIAGPCLDNTEVALFMRALLEDDATGMPAHGPAEPGLCAVAPNPCNPATTITFVLDEAVPVTLRVLDVRGRLVRTLCDGMRDAGTHRVAWDGRDERGRPCAGGTYVCRFVSGDRVESRAVTMVR